MGSDLRRQWVMYPNRTFYVLFETNPFYKEKKSVGKGFGIQGKD